LRELLVYLGVPDDEVDNPLDALCNERDGVFVTGVLDRLQQAAENQEAEAEADAIDAQVREEMADLMARLRTSVPELPPLSPLVELLRSPLPAGYILTREGLFCQADPAKPPVRLALTPVLPVRLMRTADDTDWSLCLKAVSYDGKPVARWFPLASLYGNMGKIVADLAQYGVIVENERQFRAFLLRCLDNRDALPRQRGTQKMGFVTMPTDQGVAKVCYVLPEQTIVPTGVALAEDVVLFDSVKTAVHQAFHASARWRNGKRWPSAPGDMPSTPLRCAWPLVVHCCLSVTRRMAAPTSFPKPPWAKPSSSSWLRRCLAVVLPRTSAVPPAWC